MANLPLANIFNRKTRTTVGILAVALGVALVLVLVGLAHGSLDETADRIKNVGADIIFQAPDSSPFLALSSGVVDVRYGARLLDVPGGRGCSAGVDRSAHQAQGPGQAGHDLRRRQSDL